MTEKIKALEYIDELVEIHNDPENFIVKLTI